MLQNLRKRKVGESSSSKKHKVKKIKFYLNGELKIGKKNDGDGGWGGVALKNKLRNLRLVIKQWCKEKGDIKASQIQNLKQKLHDLENLAFHRTLSESEVITKRILQQQLWDVSTAYESLLRQKSMAKWIKEGDRNTAYFHKLINFRRSSGAVQGILIDGVWVHQPDLVKQAVFNFFAERFTEQNHHRPTLDGVCFPSIDQHQRVGLTAPFSDIELKDAVWSCAGDKCPGPDGFNFIFQGKNAMSNATNEKHGCMRMMYS